MGSSPPRCIVYLEVGSLFGVSIVSANPPPLSRTGAVVLSGTGGLSVLPPVGNLLDHEHHRMGFG